MKRALPKSPTMRERRDVSSAEQNGVKREVQQGKLTVAATD